MKNILHILLFFTFNIIFISINAQDPAYPTATLISNDTAFCESGKPLLKVAFTGEKRFAFAYKIGISTYWEGTIKLSETQGDHTIDENYIEIEVPSAVSSDASIEIVRVYDSNYQYVPNDPNNSGVEVTGQVMNCEVFERPSPSAGVYDPICGYELTFNGTVTDPTHTIYWNDMTGVGTYSDINSPTSSFTADQEGDVTFILTEINGVCTATDEATVKFLGSPTATLNSSGEFKFCSSDSDPDFISMDIAFTGNAPFNYKINEGVYTSDGDTDNPSIEVFASGEYSITEVSDVNGCYAPAEDITGTQIVTDLKPDVDAGDNQNVCGDQYVLQAQLNSGNSGLWTSSVGSIFDVASDKNATATYSGFDLKQDVTFTWTETEPEMGCSDYDDVIITFIEYPELIIPTISDKICQGNSTYMDYTLTGNGPWNLTYTDGLTTEHINGIEVSSSSFEFTPSFDETMNLESQTLYSFTRVEDALGCVKDYNNERLYAVSVDEKPIADIGVVDVAVCGKKIVLDPQITIVDGIWSGEGVFTANEDGTTTFTASDFGESTIKWDVINGACNDISDQRTITFKKVPYPVNAGEDRIIYGTLDFDLNAEAFDNIPDAEGMWTSLELTDIKSPNDSITAVSVDDYGIYNFVWTTSIPGLECEDWDLDDTVQIKVKKLIIPTGFSPNNKDGNYDFFKIYGLENLTNTKLTVFDKRGKLVYKCEDCYNKWESEGWNGIGKDGALLPGGTYYIVFESDELSEPRKQYLIIR